MTGSEKRLRAFCLLALSLWAMEGLLHPLESSMVMVVVLGLMLLPGVGVMRWREAEQHVPWGAVGLLGVRVSLDTVLINSQAAAWLADKFFGALGISRLSSLLLAAGIVAISTTVHLAFASATALSSVLVPIVIGLVQQQDLPGHTVWWVILINQFSISFGFLLPEKQDNTRSDENLYERTLHGIFCILVFSRPPMAEADD
jgi:di/tricarboxylate transporter